MTETSTPTVRQLAGQKAAATKRAQAAREEQVWAALTPRQRAAYLAAATKRLNAQAQAQG